MFHYSEMLQLFCVLFTCSSRSASVQQLWGAPWCHTGCPSTPWLDTDTCTHTGRPTHKPMITEFIVSVSQGGTKQKNGCRSCRRSNMHGQTYTLNAPTCSCIDIPAHVLTNTHTIPGAQYRVHYFGMPQCFPLNTRCTQTSLGLTAVTHTGLQQTNMIAWLPVWLQQVHV